MFLSKQIHSLSWLEFHFVELFPEMRSVPFFPVTLPAQPHTLPSIYIENLVQALVFLCVCVCVFQTKETKRVFVKYSCTKLFFKCPSNFLGKTLVPILKMLIYSIRVFFLKIYQFSKSMKQTCGFYL